MDEHITSGQPAKPWLTLEVSQPLQGPAGAFDLRVNLTVPQGEFLLLTGPSGAGKTTLLRVLAGLQRPANGRLQVGGALWCETARHHHLPVNRRPIGVVFQDYALFPNMTVERNLRYALGRRGEAAEAARLMSLVGLSALAKALPARLSGGQKQRLALIRALARRPQLLLLDEPLSALDPELRHQLQDEILRLHREFATTTIMVSHDPSEIAHLADRVIRLENGRVVHDGPNPRETGLLIEHLSGPDAEGYCEALVHGRPCRLRYPVPPGGLARGTQLRLDRVEPA